ncbi:MAG: glutaredoxin 3 [Natronospirillum sp.]
MIEAPDIVIYTTRYCPYCVRAKALLDSKQLPYQEVSVDGAPEERAEMTRRAQGSRTVPQIWINDTHIGGCDELYQMERQQKLDDLTRRK